MFGIADNQEGQAASTTMPPNSTPPTLDSSHPDADTTTVSSAPPAATDMAESTLPPPQTTQPTVVSSSPSGDTALSAVAPNTDEVTGAPTSTTTVAPSVHLANSYIMTDPPGVGGNAKDNTKPAPAVAVSADDSKDLLQMKQQALQNLEPLVDKLDQTPEEKFKTTMMLIQASDNAELVKEAFAAANEIPDEKQRAHALLDVVNEINYFTQHQQ